MTPSGQRHRQLVQKALLAGWILICGTVSIRPQDLPKAYQPKPESLPRPVAPQPIPFSHKKHAAAGLACAFCHPTAQTKDWAGLPAAGDCMACHRGIRADTPDIRELARRQERGLALDWVRVYDVPDYVFFSHARHLRGGLECATCHGPVAEREVLAQEVSTGMISCMNCHAERKVSNACHFCHTLGH